MKKVSIIIPFYSGIEWLHEAVESAINQTYSNIEIIVVNDGSKEDLTNFQEKFKEDIIYVYQNNKGAAAARNYGIRLAKGEYLAFLDSDDLWLPTKLEKQINFMEKIDAKWCHTNYYYWTPETDALKNVFINDEYGDIYKKTFVSVRIATPCVVISREVFAQYPEIKFPENYRIGQDTKLWQEISKYYPIALIKEPLVKVRLRSDNTYKQIIKSIQMKANDYKIIRLNSDIPKFAKFRSFIFYLYSFIFKLPSTSWKEFLARCFVSFPYILGRIYVKYLSLLNTKYKLFVC